MTNLDFLLEKKENVRVWVNNPMTKKFMEYLQLERAEVVKHLRDAEGSQAVGVAQGELKRLDKILSLPSVINDRSNDVKK